MGVGVGGARDLNEEGADGLAVGERAGVFGRDGGDVPGAVRGAERAVRGGSAGGPAEGFGVVGVMGGGGGGVGGADGKGR